MWNAEDGQRFYDAYGAAGRGDAGLRAVATLALQLAAERAGTMTAEQMRLLLAGDASVPEPARQHIIALGATVATLQGENARMKAILGSFDKRCADALADEVAVLVRRQVIDARSPAGDALLDYRNPPSTPRADRLTTLQAKVEEMTILIEQANGVLAKTASERNAAIAEVERLKARSEAEIAELRRAVQHEATRRKNAERDTSAAESRLAAVRRASVPVAQYIRRCHETGRGVETVVVQGEDSAILMSVDAQVFLDVLDSDAPNSPGILDGSGGTLDPTDGLPEPKIRATMRVVSGGAEEERRELQALGVEVPQEVKGQCPAFAWCCHPAGHAGFHEEAPGVAPRSLTRPDRFPCSPTCTHDDAATPGHPERVRQRSEAFTEAMPIDTPICPRCQRRFPGAKVAHGGEPCDVPLTGCARLKAIGLFSAGHAAGVADGLGAGHPERVKERSEAWKEMHPNGSCTCAGEGTCKWCDDAAAKAAESAGYDEGLSKGWDDGTEAMRAAVEAWAREYFGSLPPTLEAVIVGVAP